MQAEIITIGDEILTGQTVDTNSAYIATQLNLIGIPIREISSVTDKKQHILTALERSLTEADLVIITGGLGPTNDDITKKVLTEFFKDELVLYPEILKGIEEYFEALNVDILKVNRDQALLPKRARIIENELGTAAGMWFTKGEKHVISLPGVPYEMKGLMEKLLPMFSETFHLADFYHETILFQGIGESKLADQLVDLEQECNMKSIGVAYLPSPGIVKMRFTGRLEQKNEIIQIVDNLENQYPKLVFGHNGDLLESVIGNLLRERGETLGTVESCTGGGIAHRITSVPGSSAYFTGSIVSYDNIIKKKLARVPEDILASDGAVSENCIRAMAEGGIKVLDVDYCIATSGIAGPDGGTEDKPVGTVWIAIATRKEVYTRKFQFRQNRERNIELTIVSALNFLRRVILQIH